MFEIITGKDDVSKSTFAECLQELFFHSGNKLTGSSAHKFRMLTFAMLTLLESVNLLGAHSMSIYGSTNHVLSCVCNLGNESS